MDDSVQYGIRGGSVAVEDIIPVGNRKLAHYDGGVVDDRKPLEYKNFVEFIYEKPVGDKGYIGKSLFEKLMVNLLSALAAYCCFPKKPCIKVRRTYDIQPSLF